MAYLILETFSPFFYLGPRLWQPDLYTSQQETRILVEDTYLPKREEPGAEKLDGRCQVRKEGSLFTEYLIIV